MKLRAIVIAAATLIASGQAWGAEAPALTEFKDKVSYSIGLDIGSKLKAQSVEVNPEALLRGVNDGYSGAAPLMTDNEVRTTLVALQKQLMAKQEERARVQGEKNRKEGEAFLADNAKKEGVKTLPSGLQYKVIKEGTGPVPKATDRVETNYRGTLIDGTEFDSSYKRGMPAVFPVNAVIAGWTEALQLMKVGSKWQLFVPSKLAYGERGAGREIGPDATLVFEVELLGIKEPAPPPSQGNPHQPQGNPHQK
jgi:FKBP-type peptidyl-prolyl cis-trans isomerase FklB